MEVLNLWPEDLKPKGTLGPIGILRSQAALLHRTTAGLLEGEVVTEAEGASFIHHFNVIAIALGGFRYELLTVRHGIPDYPVRVKLGHKDWNSSQYLQSDDELKAWLKEQLASAKPIIEKLWAESLPQSDLVNAG